MTARLSGFHRHQFAAGPLCCYQYVPSAIPPLLAPMTARLSVFANICSPPGTCAATSLSHRRPRRSSRRRLHGVPRCAIISSLPGVFVMRPVSPIGVSADFRADDLAAFRFSRIGDPSTPRAGDCTTFHVSPPSVYSSFFVTLTNSTIVSVPVDHCRADLPSRTTFFSCNPFGVKLCRSYASCSRTTPVVSASYIPLT